MNTVFHSFLIFFAAIIISCRPDAGTVSSDEKSADALPSLDKTKDFSEDRNAYFGDLHVHSSWSFDAFIYNVRTSPEDAYRFGKGEAIDHAIAGKIQNKRPLDFMSVTDHAEYMGIMMQMIDPSSPLAAVDLAQRVRSEDRATSLDAFAEVGRSIAYNRPIRELIKKEIIASTWQKQIEIANRHYQPGKFTTFPAYEWTSTPSRGSGAPENLYAANMHRNVIYRGDQVSDIPFSSFDSQDPEALWQWMEKEKANGIDLIAIPHNGNMSDGLMYSAEGLNGQPIDAAYAKLRSDSEPINEVVQIKGQSMSHPVLNPNDEFANFEVYGYTFAVGPPPASQPEGSYVRQAYQEGLKYQKNLGVNPFNFGLIGSSDGHNSAGPVEENNYFGKLGNIDGNPQTRLQTGAGGKFLRARQMSAAGLAGVWAEENTREAIYSAMKRREVFATSGPRIKMRFFAGPDLNQIELDQADWVNKAYASAVPMGSDMKKTGASPQFIIWAVKDPDGANLDRIQVIKQWLDLKGETHERIYNVAWAGDREVSTDGQLTPVGNTVNVSDASYENTIGSVSLSTTWTDPDFNSAEAAMYFLRILEIPTPRWTTYDAVELGVPIPDNLDATIQERAWSSPIWYRPE